MSPFPCRISRARCPATTTGRLPFLLLWPPRLMVLGWRTAAAPLSLWLPPTRPSSSTFWTFSGFSTNQLQKNSFSPLEFLHVATRSVLQHTCMQMTGHISLHAPQIMFGFHFCSTAGSFLNQRICYTSLSVPLLSPSISFLVTISCLHSRVKSSSSTCSVSRPVCKATDLSVRQVICRLEPVGCTSYTTQGMPRVTWGSA